MDPPLSSRFVLFALRIDTHQDRTSLWVRVLAVLEVVTGLTRTTARRALPVVVALLRHSCRLNGGSHGVDQDSFHAIDVVARREEAVVESDTTIATNAVRRPFALNALIVFIDVAECILGFPSFDLSVGALNAHVDVLLGHGIVGLRFPICRRGWRRGWRWCIWVEANVGAGTSLSVRQLECRLAMLSPALEVVSVRVFGVACVAFGFGPVFDIRVDPNLESVAVGKLGGNTTSSPWV